MNNLYWCHVFFLEYSTFCLKRPLKKKAKIRFQDDHSLMKVKSIAECSKGSILQYFEPSLSYHLPLRPLFCLYLSDRLWQVFIVVAGKITWKTMKHTKLCKNTHTHMQDETKHTCKMKQHTKWKRMQTRMQTSIKGSLTLTEINNIKSVGHCWSANFWYHAIYHSLYTNNKIMLTARVYHYYNILQQHTG